MSAINVGGVLRAEHEVMHTAFTEWVGENRENAMEDVQYLWGVHDMAHKILTMLEEDANE